MCTPPHLHARPVLSVYRKVSVIGRIQVFGSELVSYESQVLSKDHTPPGLSKNKRKNVYNGLKQLRETTQHPNRNTSEL